MLHFLKREPQAFAFKALEAQRCNQPRAYSAGLDATLRRAFARRLELVCAALLWPQPVLLLKLWANFPVLKALALKSV
jgi:hypothetical protein